MYSEIMDAFSDQDCSLARVAESTERHAEAQMVEDCAKSRKFAGLSGIFHVLNPTMAKGSTDYR